VEANLSGKWSANTCSLSGFAPAIGHYVALENTYLSVGAKFQKLRATRSAKEETAELCDWT